MLINPLTLTFGGGVLLLLFKGKKRKSGPVLGDFTMKPGIRYVLAADVKSGTQADIDQFLADLAKQGATNIGADGTFLSWDPPPAPSTVNVPRLWTRGRLVLEIIACSPSTADYSGNA